MTEADVNAVMAEAAAGPMKGVLGYTEEKLVSVDFNHTSESSYFAARPDQGHRRPPGARAGMV